MAKGKKTGGRRKGSINKRGALARAAMDGGILPLDYMLQVMRDPEATNQRRDYMSVAAAPYLHAKRAPEDKHGETQTYVLITNVDPADA